MRPGILSIGDDKNTTMAEEEIFTIDILSQYENRVQSMIISAFVAFLRHL